VNVASVAALIRASPRLVTTPAPKAIGPSLPSVLPADPYNYTTYVMSLFLSVSFLGGYFTQDGAGNLYGRLVSQDNKLYKVAPNGTQTFIAGNGVENLSFIPGLGAAAQFDNSINKFVIDSLGNVFTYSSTFIVKIEPNGNVTQYAGTGDGGIDDGDRTTARFGTITAIAIDALNTLYVHQSGMHTIRKITSAGQVSTLTFSSTFTPNFYGMDVDSTGVIYVTDSSLHRVYKITPTGPTTADIALLAGSSFGYADGQGSAARFFFDGSSGVCVDMYGNVYVGDTGNGSIRKITPSGLVTTIAGNGTLAIGSNSNTQLYYPSSVSVDVNGAVYTGVGDVRKITPVS
jgi:hypothetical protein